jgi:hypothetical protein
MLGAGCEIQKEGLVRRELLGVGDKADRRIHQIRRQVITLFRGLRRLDLAVVADEVGVVLAGVTPEKPIVALETATERPPIVRCDPCGRGTSFRADTL